MDKDEIEKLARKAGMSPREYCLKQIETWKRRLQTASEDYRNLSDDEFARRVEKDIDEWRNEQRS